MAASSTLLPCFFFPITTAISSKPGALASPFRFSPNPSFSRNSRKISLFSSSFPLSVNARAILPKVALQSEIEQEEEDVDFSPDLKLFVGNLPFSVDSAELAGLFECSGNVEMVEVIYDKLTGNSRGFGFVTMSTVEEVEAAVQQFNGYELKGRVLRVNSGPPPPKDEFSSQGRGGTFDVQSRRGGTFDVQSRSGGTFDAPNRVYVGNLPWGVDNLALETLFSELGKVMEAKVVYDRESGRSRGFGFVTYSSPDEVNKAISSLNGFEFDGRPIRVTVAEARPRR